MIVATRNAYTITIAIDAKDTAPASVGDLFNALLGRRSSSVERTL